jgi:uncharacterized protein YbjT (DUF2867 family)
LIAQESTTRSSGVGRSALLVGASGLVGSHCLDLLTRDPTYERIIVLVRRPIPDVQSPKLEQHVVDFDHLEQLPASVRAQDVFCALGTTIKQAGSEAAFRKVDLNYPINVAKLMLERGAEQFIVVSSLGANPKARVMYSRVKGEMEAAVSALPYQSIAILRPSLLLGERKEFRLGEELAKRVGFLMTASYKPVHARKVAAAMIQVARQQRPGTRIIESADISRADVVGN